MAMAESLMRPRLAAMVDVLLCILVMAGTAQAAGLDEGQALYAAGDVAGARAAFQAVIEEQPGNAEAAYLLGVTYLDAGQPRDALEWLEQAVELAPDESRYYQHAGEALGLVIRDASMFTKMRKAGRVLEYFERAVALDPDNLEARRGLITYYLNAPRVAGGGRGKAEAEAREIARRDAVTGHHAWASIYLRDQDFARSLASLDAAIEANPDATEAQLMRGIVLTEQQEFDLAFEHFLAWRDRAPDASDANYQMGRICALSGKHLEQGEAALLSYIQHQPQPGQPSHAWAYYRLGQVYLHMQREEAARKAMRTALELDPGHKQARKGLRKLRD